MAVFVSRNELLDRLLGGRIPSGEFEVESPICGSVVYTGCLEQAQCSELRPYVEQEAVNIP